jgi:cbb3-type cytochrome oxidase subunit 3
VSGTLPWYKRPILPAWFPGWLAASLLIALGFAAAFGFLLDSDSPLVTAAVAGALGFGIALTLLSVVAARYRSGKPNHLAPPAVIWRPIVTGLIVLYPVFWVSDRQIRLPSRHGTAPTLFDGTVAEVIGLLVLFSIVVGLCWTLLNKHRRDENVSAARLFTLAVAIVALGYAAFRAARFHA